MVPCALERRVERHVWPEGYSGHRADVILQTAHKLGELSLRLKKGGYLSRADLVAFARAEAERPGGRDPTTTRRHLAWLKEARVLCPEAGRPGSWYLHAYHHTNRTAADWKARAAADRDRRRAQARVRRAQARTPKPQTGKLPAERKRILKDNKEMWGGDFPVLAMQPGLPAAFLASVGNPSPVPPADAGRLRLKEEKEKGKKSETAPAAIADGTRAVAPSRSARDVCAGDVPATAPSLPSPRPFSIKEDPQSRVELTLEQIELHSLVDDLETTGCLSHHSQQSKNHDSTSVQQPFNIRSNTCSPAGPSRDKVAPTTAAGPKARADSQGHGGTGAEQQGRDGSRGRADAVRQREEAGPSEQTTRGSPAGQGPDRGPGLRSPADDLSWDEWLSRDCR